MAHDEFWKQQFHAAGNSPEAWRHSALGLLAAAKRLQGEFAAALAGVRALSVGQPTPDALMYLEPILLLRGCAVECLLKARAIDSVGAVLARGGEYKGPKHHDLVKLALWAQFPISEDEARLLETLTIFIQRGRYPILASWEHGLNEGPPEVGKLAHRFGWVTRSDEATFAAIVSRLLPKGPIRVRLRKGRPSGGVAE